MRAAYCLILSLMLPAPAFAGEALTEGVYSLSGANAPGSEKKYKGKVIIKKMGEVYKLVWLIGTAQTQTGVAILENKILSVGYMDLSGKDFGVVSFKVVSPKKLEGKWSSMGSKGSFGTETLEFESKNAEMLEGTKPSTQDSI